LNLRVPRHALALSQLVSVENRIDFAERFVGELRTQLAAGMNGAALDAWLDQRLARYGKDGRFLVAPGIRACLAAGEPDLRPHLDVLQAVFHLSK